MVAKVLHDSMTLGRALQDARRRLGLSQAVVAERSGVRQATVSEIEQGRTRVAFETVLRVMSALELELLCQPRSAQPESHWE